MRTLIFLIFTTFTLQLYAQKSSNINTNPHSLITKVFVLKNVVGTESARFPFRSIYVRDSRNDTTKVGFYDTGIKGRYGFKKMQFKGGLSTSLSRYLNQHYSKSFDHSTYELFVDIKKFWITGLKAYITSAREINNPKHKEKLYVKWEFYIVKNNSYLPVVRIDTVIDISATFLRNNEENDANSRYPELRHVLNRIVEQINYQAWIENFDRRQQVTLETINIINNKWMTLNKPGIDSIKNGEYERFADFVNNQPTASNWEAGLKQMNFVEDYKRNLNDSIGADHFYAFAHNGTLFLNIEKSTKLIETGSTFEFFKLIPSVSGAGFVLPYPTGFGTLYIPITWQNKNWTWVPMQIDMETGLPY